MKLTWPGMGSQQGQPDPGGHAAELARWFGLDMALTMARKDALKRFHELDGDYGAIQLTWHTFKIDAVLEQSRELLKLVQLLNEEANVRIHQRNSREQK